MSRSRHPLCLTLFVFVLALLDGAATRADVRLPRVLSDRMVLQRDQPIPIWGFAAPGEEVTVTLGDNNSAKTTADGKGNWRVNLAATPAGGPHKLTIAGKNTLTLQNILVGEVWLCAGQSNMEWPLARTQHAGRDIPQATDPQLRLCKADPIVSSVPEADGAVNWMECNSGSAAGFSAVAYYFGKELREKLNVPVGIIYCAAGGTAIETWIPVETCSQVPSLKKVARLVKQVNTDYQKLCDKNKEAWEAAAKQARAEGKPEPPFKPVDPIIIQRGWLPTGIFNGGVKPLIPFGIRGVVWYQGEANNGDGLAYLEKFRALIESWRAAWGQGDFPFLYVQIAPWAGYPAGNIEGVWESQREALAIPNTGMAVISDLVPNINDIHPVQKLDVGERLARLALSRTYGKDGIVDSGPLLKSVTCSDGKCRIEFDHAGSGLATRDGQPPNFFQVGTAAGFEDAQAKIDGNAVIAWSDKVPSPEYVRFGWKNSAQPNLINKEGLPASPFRTDISAVRFNTGSKFASRKLVELSSDAQGTIRYTLDGSAPTKDSTEYKSPIEIDRTTTVSARLFQDSGASSLMTQATYTKVEPVAVDGKTLGPGLDYEFFVGKWNALPEFETLKVEKRGVVDTLTLAASPQGTQYALRFRGYLDIPKDGEYTFVLKADDGSRFYLDGKLVIDHDGQHAATPMSSPKLTLKAGKHPIEILYHESWGGSHLSLAYEGPGISMQEIPATAWFREE